MLIHADCLESMRQMQSKSVDLVYLDSPFFSQKEHSLVNTNGKRYSFSDKWSSRDEYLAYIEERLVEIRRIVKDTGNIFFHCDNYASHYIKILLDKVFGEVNFRSEIIWSYRKWSNSKKGLLDGHQVIFHYSSSPNFKFNTIYVDYSPATNVDQILQLRERRDDGKVVYKRNQDGSVEVAKAKKRSSFVRCLGNSVAKSKGQGKDRIPNSKTDFTFVKNNSNWLG